MQAQNLDTKSFNSGFTRRHIGLDGDDTTSMLEAINIASLTELVKKAVPSSIYSSSGIDLPKGKSEEEALAKLRKIAAKNKIVKSYIGLGYYNNLVPTPILRNLIENPSWYTPYTPYQAEISQGRLEMLLAFQNMVTDLTAMEVANASLLDESTAAVEAMLMCWRLTNKDTNKYIVDKYCHPQTLAVVQTRAEPLGIDVVVKDLSAPDALEDCFGVLLQYPDTKGVISDIASSIDAAHKQQALVSVATDLLALTLLQAPGEMGADIVFGNSQRFGVPLGFGGPHAAFFATMDKYKRSMPGRIIGISQDSFGNLALRMALQTREQHIRRDKANSNICTAQSLLAVVAVSYAIYHGPKGLTAIASRVHDLTQLLATGLLRLGYSLLSNNFFDTITVLNIDSAYITAAALEQGLNIQCLEGKSVTIAFDETTSLKDVELLWRAFAPTSELNINNVSASLESNIGIKAVHRRQSSFLTAAVFHTYHSETSFMRYVKFLADKDIGLDRAMIPLGSCTMKLNAAAEMVPISWPSFANMHPFAPAQQTHGYQSLLRQLEHMLCEITGYAAVSLQPNAGSQGELAGLLVIRAYHHSRGDKQRNICLIPTSAHGTNPASAVVAGFKVVTVKCDDQGDIDLSDLIAKAEIHKENLAALMVTYPSTHGVYEENIQQVCHIIHDHGGQVYLDGANLNSLLGIAYPGKFGADVSHINLHKTFAIPHGGGGPGMGPIGVGAHLAKFLPSHNLVDMLSTTDVSIGPISAAPWGSAGILPISWMYIDAVGGDGLLKSSQSAILSANYIAKKLRDYYPVLYSGNHGLVAHECIIDLRPIKAATAISEEDIAKRLIDYGFHAPTMSFPVASTLMIEPTESESKHEIDRFCNAMISIHAEIDKVKTGVWSKEDNPLKNAPHTAASIAVARWEHSYTREEAVYPVESLRANKYWAPVGRVNSLYGDRNFCADINTIDCVKF